MARLVDRLTALKVSRANKPGTFPDGRGLYLQVAGPASKSWVYRYTINGRERFMGLGSALDISLADARTAATEARTLRGQGVDPIEARNAHRAAVAVEAAKAMTFDECVAAFLRAKDAGWKNAKHRQQWRNTLANYASPVFGKLPVASIDTGLVVRALEPIWHAKPETGVRVRGRVEAVLDWATVAGYRRGDNPARWNGLLEHVLDGKARKVKNQPALPYAQTNAFLTVLRASKSIGAPALEFQILTAVRPGVVQDIPWSEIDLDARRWDIPAQRMKMKKAHSVPLSDRAIAILRERQALGLPYVFGSVAGAPLSENALNNTLKQLPGAWNDPDGRRAVAHGFRSTFKTWATECSGVPAEVIEAAMAHDIGGAVERVYLRSDLFERRRKLMGDWAAFCEMPQTHKVIRLHSAATASAVVA